MRKTSRLLALVFIAFMLLGSTQIHVLTPYTDETQPMSAQFDILRTSGYDSPNITATLSSPANGSSVSGIFAINLNMTSDFATINITLFVESAIYPAYNETNVPAGPSWTQVLTIDSTTLAEGMLNFTILFENLAEKESVYLLYFVDNESPNFEIELYDPANGTEISGQIDVKFNITSDYDVLNLTLFIDGNPLAPYNPSLIGTGNISILVDTAGVMEGYDNFTFYFQYDVLETHFSYSYYLVYLVDNDGLPITIDHQSPANQTEVHGVFNLTLLIGSEYDPLNFTLFVDGIVHYPEYNNTYIGIKEQTISINTTTLVEGARNFTLLFEYNVTGENARATYYLVFIVNNHGAPIVVIISPSSGSTVTGLTELWLNITSTHPELFMNITVDDELTEEFNATQIFAGADNYSIDTSRYENGEHVVGVIVYTAEGLSSTVTINLIFLDHVRVWISGLTNYEEISGTIQFGIRVLTPYDNVSVALYVDDILASEIDNITVLPGYNSVSLNTTPYTEGEHNITLLGFDSFGHRWEFKMVLIINNKGAPDIRFASTAAVMIGLATFTVNVDSDWDILNVSVYVDDNVLPEYTNISVNVSSGTFTFSIDMGAYSKTEHTVRVVMITPEGEQTSIERVFGFASIRIEEIISFAILLGLGLIIPLYRKTKGHSIKPVLILDVVFALVIGGAFLILGINTIPFLVWHFNLASIWAIGGVFVFANWALPILMEETES